MNAALDTGATSRDFMETGLLSSYGAYPHARVLNVGRRHTTNNIYFEINIEKFSYTQKCHAEMCKTYISPKIGLLLLPHLFFSTREHRENYR